MNQILKGMKERRSIRKFQSKMPEKKAIQKIVEAGLYAANGRGEQAVLTIAITNKKMRDKIWQERRKAIPLHPLNTSMVHSSIG